MAKTKRKSERVTVKIGKIKPYAKNAKKHTQASIEKLADQIKAVGYISKIVVDEKLEILVGHRRLGALLFLKWTEVEVQKETGLTATQKRACRLADNRLSEDTESDADLLIAELEDLSQIEGFDLSLTGYDGGEIIELLAPEETPPSKKTVKKTVKQMITCPECGHVWDEAKKGQTHGES